MYFDCDDGHIHSTSGMLNRASKSEAEEFVVATETGILHRMEKENPEKKFYAANDNAVCEYMKMITLEKLHDSLKNDRFEVKVPEELVSKARRPIERMLSIA